MTPSPLYGLVLAGGASRRMGRDKAALQYDGKAQLLRAYELLSGVCERAFVSVRREQQHESMRAQLPQIIDIHDDLGPIAGIAAAQARHPEVAWLVMACDLPNASASLLKELIAQRDTKRVATAFRSAYGALPEPLCAIWEPASRALVESWIAAGKECPRKLLIDSDVALLDQPQSTALDNINTPEEYSAAQRAFAVSPIELHIQYFAILREQTGQKHETLRTSAGTPAQLYDELRQRYAFKLAPTQLKVAVNTEFRDWHSPLQAGDHVAFIPPVAGG